MTPYIFGSYISTELNTNEDTKQGSVILSKGNYTAGVLQVFYDGLWIDVCSSTPTAHVACRQLGYYGALSVFNNLTAIG